MQELIKRIMFICFYHCEYVYVCFTIDLEIPMGIAKYLTHVAFSVLGCRLEGVYKYTVLFC
jgi:hypothetical protein